MTLVRYFASARSATGQAEERVPAASVGELLTTLAARHPIGRILAVSSLLVDGRTVARTDTDRALGDDSVVDVLPPFAGG